MKRKRSRGMQILSMFLVFAMLLGNVSVASAEDMNPGSGVQTVQNVENAAQEEPDVETVTSASDVQSEQEIQEEDTKQDIADLPDAPDSETEETAEDDTGLAQARQERETPAMELGFVPGQVLVMVPASLEAAKTEEIIQNNGGEIIGTLGLIPESTVYLVSIDEKKTVAQAAADFASEESVESATPDYIMQAYEDSAVETALDEADTSAGAETAFPTYFEQIHAQQAQALLKAHEHSPVKAAVLDAFESSEHGTEVENIIKSIAGDYDTNAVELQSVNVFTQGYTSFSSVIAALEQSIADGAKIVNMSFGTELGETTDDRIFRKACDAAYAQGTLLIAAAGNDGVEDQGNIQTIPSDYDSVVSVIATDESGNRAESSNYGEKKNLAAPGLGAGTSYAASMVTAAATMLFSADTALTNVSAKNILTATAVNVNEDDQIGAGVVNIAAALEAIGLKLEETGPAKEDTAKEDTAKETAEKNTEKEIAAVQGEDTEKDPAVSIEKLNVAAGTFTARITGITDENVEKVLVPVWCASNKNDIVWYVASKQKDGSYTADVNISKHKYHVGTYKVHVYTENEKEERTFVKSTSVKMIVASNAMTAAENTKGISWRASVSGVVVPGGLKKVMFAVWSSTNGQDDLVWYTAKKLVKGTYAATIYPGNHKSLGRYYVHAYAVSKSGQMISLNQTEFKVASPSAGKVTVSNLNYEEGTFSVVVSEIKTPSAVKAVNVPIWCESDQSDIKWYKAKRQSDGTYKVDVNISAHKYHAGVYKIHTYITDVAGKQTAQKTTQCNLKASMKSLTVTDSAKKEISFQAVASGIKVPAGTKKVSIAVWSKSGGQDDLRWYDMKKSGSTYRCSIPVKNHKTLGTYSAHVYAQGKNGAMIFLGGQTFQVKNAAKASVKIGSVNASRGIFAVTVSGIVAPAGVEKVEVPVWYSNDQSDIVWYTAKKQSNGTYRVNVSVKDHRNHSGTYRAHVYITMQNGIKAFAGSTKGRIDLSNYIYTTSLGSGRVKIAVINPNVNGVAATEVQFPTWSNAGGQDDIIWYSAGKSGKSWTATIDGRKHHNWGDFTSHVYATVNGEQSYVGKTSYTVPAFQFADKIASFSTLSTNDQYGTFNMKRALAAFNGLIVQPGETVSFFGVTGPCGQEDGYVLGGVIGGNGYGGGICQSATTVYGGIVRAGLTVLQRQNHSLSSTYVPRGEDAMVSYGDSDLVFRNDWEFPIKIETYSEGQMLYIDIYGEQPSWYDYVQVNSWETGAHTASANREFIKNGQVVRRDSLPDSYYSN
ncbi:GBS Bsp-like repeat-containing protein [Hespellia stercorisuis]|uniref:GBS Bsp-like repeat-containing protein n=1 Tax=Hespellia stercorisuis DSM 15480 TaxID=1121950 RepID=A0A1M6Q6F1_9FIRM|nr:GBS Bsp-like repeat-containing protein [Hespellia stercorisuis]SHK15697.1 GBS Bsp-like repeat-containing protein [Hespellia stercorisuis DSM 15480]